VAPFYWFLGLLVVAHVAKLKTSSQIQFFRLFRLWTQDIKGNQPGPLKETEEKHWSGVKSLGARVGGGDSVENGHILN
jgi:hypothetical protein